MSATPSSIPSESASGVAGELRQAGNLTACTNFSVPAMAMFDADGKPVGVNTEIDQELAHRMGLAPDVQDLPFNALLDAVVSGRCDISVSSQNILASRLARIDMIPYTKGVLHLVVLAVNTTVHTLLDACGHSLAVQTGSTYANYVRSNADYAANGLDGQCRAAGRPDVDLHEFDDPQAAINALRAGQVDIYIGNDLIALQEQAAFRLAVALPPVSQGIGVAKTHPALSHAIASALQAMIDDGAYAAILAKYGASQLSIQGP